MRRPDVRDLDATRPLSKAAALQTSCHCERSEATHGVDELCLAPWITSAWMATLCFFWLPKSADRVFAAVRRFANLIAMPDLYVATSPR